MHRANRPAPLPPQAVRRYYLRTTGPAAFWTLVTLFGVTLAFIGGPLWRYWDTRGCRVQEESAIVRQVVDLPSRYTDPRCYVVVRFTGADFPGADVAGYSYASLRPGQRVQVRYHVGRSGWLYVDMIRSE